MHQLSYFTYLEMEPEPRLKIRDLDGKLGVLTLKLDLEYWPTYELRKVDGVWHRVGLGGELSSIRWADSSSGVSEPALEESVSGGETVGGSSEESDEARQE